MSIKTNFPLLNKQKNLVYLDSASTSQKPQSVIDAESTFYKTANANVHRGIYKLSAAATELYERARQTVAEFINATPEEIIFTRNATEAINLVMYSYGMHHVKAGDNVVISILEHHSNFVPWQQLCKIKGAELRVINLDKNCNLDLNHTKSLIDKKTKIVAITHVSNAIGTVIDVKHAADLAHNAGAVIVIDASQSVPHMPVDFKTINADFMAFSGHKMFGPTGIGVLVGKKQLLKTMPPFLYGGDMIHSVSISNTTWNDLPWKFEAGTPNIAGAVGLAAAIDYLKSIGMKNIQKHEQQLTDYTLNHLQKINDLDIIGNPKQRGGIISFTLKNIHPHDLASVLDSENICVRAGHHCCQPLMKTLKITATARISFHIYNTKSDIDALYAAIKKAQQVFA
ncbi:MAG TPA: cysteine desulfurase [Candidatus Nanoarchaeia archaeon]|nr:cysteine desulfurase [Candidatus Nanoarchaeia archaeon]